MGMSYADLLDIAHAASDAIQAKDGYAVVLAANKMDAVVPARCAEEYATWEKAELKLRRLLRDAGYTIKAKGGTTHVEAHD